MNKKLRPDVLEDANRMMPGKDGGKTIATPKGAVTDVKSVPAKSSTPAPRNRRNMY